MKTSVRKWIILGVLALAAGSFVLNSGQDRPLPGWGEAVSSEQGKTLFTTRPERAKAMSLFMDREISRGNLRLASITPDQLGAYTHERYDVYYKDIKVWGTQLLRHTKDGEVYLINGKHYDDIQIDTTPAISKEDAVRISEQSLQPGYVLKETPELVIFPLAQGYALSYKTVLGRFDSLMVSFVDAVSGGIIFQYDNMQKEEAAIGLGTGIHGDEKKMSTDFADNVYYAIDLMRPSKIVTGTSNYSEDTSRCYYLYDTDNVWTGDPSVVDAHTYLGWIYDYYYLVHGRKGMNDANMQLVITVHLGVNYENAFFSPNTKRLYFGDGNPNSNFSFSAALDIVAHEFTHGVTDYTSKLIYSFESGALNEAFSDIMGVSCEFFHQPEGHGYLQADWWEGEDIEKNFKAGRDLSDPSSVLIWEGAPYRYPDHYSKRYILPGNSSGDYGGVHLNCTIPSHWYYLLTHGGTNKTSHMAVEGIGLSKAEKIAYRGWVYYLHPSATFRSARSATYQAAVDLYGSGSDEAQRVTRAWDAVGVH
jgi:thermolysin